MPVHIGSRLPRFNTTASLEGRKQAGHSAPVGMKLVRAVAEGAPGKPPGDGSRDREAEGDEAVLEVPLRPRRAARRLLASLRPRGENAAPVRRRRTRSS